MGNVCVRRPPPRGDGKENISSPILWPWDLGDTASCEPECVCDEILWKLDTTHCELHTQVQLTNRSEAAVSGLEKQTCAARGYSGLSGSARSAGL